MALIGKRPRIGLVTNSLQGYFNREIVNCLRECAYRQNFDLMLFPGQRVDSPLLFERQFNVVHALADAGSLDAVVCVTAFVQSFISNAQSIAFVQRYQRTPTVSLNFAVPGCPSVLVDNRTGMTHLMHHLLYHHGYRKIAFMQGPKGSLDADERFDAYCQALRQADIAVDDRLLVRGDFRRESGRKAMAELLDRQQPFQALVAANDDMALAALALAVERGFHVPQDFAITGFDDIVSFAKHGQSLTTVRQSIETMVSTAVATLTAQLAGELADPTTTIPSTLVVRQSCGCVGKSPGAGPLNHAHMGASHSTAVLARMGLSGAQLQTFGEYVDELVEALQADERTFVDSLRTMAHQEIARSGELSGLQELLLAVFSHHAAQPDIAARELERLGTRLLQGQMVIANVLNTNLVTVNRADDHSEDLSMEKGFLKRSTGNAGLEATLDLLEETLIAQGIVSAYVVAYASTLTFASMEECKVPTSSYLVFAMTQGVRIREGMGTHFPTHQLLPPGFLEGSDDQLMVLCPVFQSTEHFGYLILDLKSRESMDVERLREEISMVLIHHMQLESLKRTQSQLIQAEKLAALGSLVAGVSHELNTPIGNCVTVCSALQDESRAFAQALSSGSLSKQRLQSHLNMTAEGLAIIEGGLARSVKLLEAFKQTGVDQVSEKRRIFNLRETVQGMVALLSATLRKTPYQLEVDIPEEIVLDSFPGALEQVVGNLVNNAVLHGFEGRDHGKMTVQARQDGISVLIQFSDDGVGIPLALQSQIFDPFFTTKLGTGGNGLGLNICYNLITGPLGGSIKVRSGEGLGCTFDVRLPMQAPI